MWLTRDMSYGMSLNTEAKALGFQDKDILVVLMGEFKTFDGDLYRNLSEAKQVNIIRQGKPATLNCLAISHAQYD